LSPSRGAFYEEKKRRRREEGGFEKVERRSLRFSKDKLINKARLKVGLVVKVMRTVRTS
jgi:hypothetical protein